MIIIPLPHIVLELLDESNVHIGLDQSHAHLKANKLAVQFQILEHFLHKYHIISRDFIEES